jgi:hypothetical protein
VAFVAGYVSKHPQHATAELRERVGAFAILPGEAASAYGHGVIAIPNGHLVIKHRTTYSVAPVLKLAPQKPQNVRPGEPAAPHAGQLTGSSTPQVSQYRTSGRFSA